MFQRKRCASSFFPTERNRQTDRQTDTKTDRYRDTERDRQTVTERERGREREKERERERAIVPRDRQRDSTACFKVRGRIGLLQRNQWVGWWFTSNHLKAKAGRCGVLACVSMKRDTECVYFAFLQNKTFLISLHRETRSCSQSICVSY